MGHVGCLLCNGKLNFFVLFFSIFDEMAIIGRIGRYSNGLNTVVKRPTTVRTKNVKKPNTSKHSTLGTKKRKNKENDANNAKSGKYPS